MDLTTQKARNELATRIGINIAEHCVEIYDDGHRGHLGASIIGDECPRKLWYTFRWIFHKVHEGRMYRLFNRGHLEEDRFVGWLRGIGCTVHQYDEDGKQFRISDCDGHFGGSTDGSIELPPEWGIPGEFLTEFKTNKDSGFGQFLKDGVAITKPQHFDQMCVYGYKRGIKYAVYMVVNKNTDAIHLEIVELDFDRAKELIEKANWIIHEQTPPDKLSNSPAFFKCKMCDFREHCHKSKPAEKNCRSCTFAHAAKGGEWKCMKWNSVIPKEAIEDGCGEWVSIID
jgi:hypothetical protein